MRPLQRRLMLPDVDLQISFVDLFGIDIVEGSEQEKRDRWAQWLKLVRADGCGGGKYWCDKSECIGCKHLRGTWCKQSELPCTVNPYLTFRTGMIGMACMGAGYDA